MARQASGTPRIKQGLTLPADMVKELKLQAVRNNRLLSHEVERLLNIALDIEDGRETN